MQSICYNIYIYNYVCVFVLCFIMFYTFIHNTCTLVFWFRLEANGCEPCGELQSRLEALHQLPLLPLGAMCFFQAGRLSVVNHQGVIVLVEAVLSTAGEKARFRSIHRWNWIIYYTDDFCSAGKYAELHEFAIVLQHARTCRYTPIPSLLGAASSVDGQTDDSWNRYSLAEEDGQLSSYLMLFCCLESWHASSGFTAWANIRRMVIGVELSAVAPQFFRSFPDGKVSFFFHYSLRGSHDKIYRIYNYLVNKLTCCHMLPVETGAATCIILYPV